jgi:two-component system, OmpR family, aerobic respiration control sensor histidine kinase ArcB
MTREQPQTTARESDFLSEVSESLGLPALDPRDAPALALLGHDLRAGLSEVIGSLRLIPPESLTSASRLQVDRSIAASEALALLLEQALTLLSGRDPAQQSYVLQTDRLLSNLKLRWTPRLRALGLQFQLLAAPDLPAQLGLDGALFERVLANLLGNIAKYVKQGRVICRIGLLHERMLEVSVQDDGPGFSPASLARISTGRSTRDPSTQPGSGLGLMIVREMVEASGGTLDIRNRDGGGALVLVSLPLTPFSLTEVTEPSPEPAPDLSHLRILLADDSSTHRILHQQLLTRLGAEVVLAKDGVETIGRIERESFDLAIIDVEMPYFNGLDVIRHIRGRSDAVAKLPILALTAHSGDEASARITDVGADGMLNKPIASASLLGQAVLRAYEQKRGRSALPHPISLQTEGIDHDQFANLLKMAGPQGAAKILTHIHLDLLRTEADLIAASHGPTWPAVRAQTHVLIALAGTAGADELSQQAQALNQLAHQTRPDRGTFLALLPQLLESLRELVKFIAMKIHEQGVVL